MTTFLVITLSVIAMGVGVGCYMSKATYNRRVKEFASDSDDSTVNTEGFQKEVERIDELKYNLFEIRENIEKLDIPTPESIGSYDDTQSSLKKLSRFFEKHTSATVGTEQMILSILPSSQLGESLQSLAHVVPPDVGHAVFGDAFATLKDGVHSIPTTDFLHRFIEGASHLNHMEKLSMLRSLEHHSFVGACMTPIKSGTMEAVGIHDAAHDIVSSLHDVGNEMLSSAETTVDVSDLTNVTDFDVTGHMPVITMALSSYREFQLLSDDKTDFISSLKNISLDAVGTGGGAIVGAKVGALAGSVFGPVGTFLGGLIGGIGGAIGGRRVTNNIKTGPLKDAIANYESQYVQMKSDTTEKSRNTACNIKSFAERKRSEFQNSSLLEDIPVDDAEQIVAQIALVLYQFVVNELLIMREKSTELRKSIWYSEKKYDAIIASIENEIETLESQLPPVDCIKDSPEKVIEVLLNLDMPNRKSVKAFQDKIDECVEELKTLNDKNNSAVLVWSYMVNNLYQKTLNDIADYSNSQMKSLNEVFQKWKDELADIEETITKEKGKLGLA